MYLLPLLLLLLLLLFFFKYSDQKLTRKSFGSKHSYPSSTLRDSGPERQSLCVRACVCVCVCVCVLSVSRNQFFGPLRNPTNRCPLHLFFLRTYVTPTRCHVLSCCQLCCQLRPKTLWGTPRSAVQSTPLKCTLSSARTTQAVHYSSTIAGMCSGDSKGRLPGETCSSRQTLSIIQVCRSDSLRVIEAH